jgi:hypothetical protein
MYGANASDVTDCRLCEGACIGEDARDDVGWLVVQMMEDLRTMCGEEGKNRGTGLAEAVAGRQLGVGGQQQDGGLTGRRRRRPGAAHRPSRRGRRLGTTASVDVARVWTARQPLTAHAGALGFEHTEALGARTHARARVRVGHRNRVAREGPDWGRRSSVSQDLLRDTRVRCAP